MISKLIDPKDFNYCVSKLRIFFMNRGFIEVYPNLIDSIPIINKNSKISKLYNFNKSIWSDNQIGQIWLDNILLDNPELNGCFRITTNSIKDQKDFPIFEFGSKGNIDNLLSLEKSLLNYMGFVKRNVKIKNNINNRVTEKQEFGRLIGDKSEINFLKKDYLSIDYLECLKKYGVHKFEHIDENRLCGDHGDVFIIKNYPVDIKPLWNIKIEDQTVKNINVLLHGKKTISSAEHSCDRETMKNLFKNQIGIENLYNKFDKNIVNLELSEYFDKHFFPRCGGKIEITQMIHALKISDLMEV